MTDQRYSVVEVFGPTIQGEGPQAGQTVAFVRFGGCDFRCEWCDSMYAVEPSEVRENAEKLTAAEIVAKLPDLGRSIMAPATVILSGGNPALIHGEQLADALGEDGWKFHVETQGTVWRPWLLEAELVVVSPKPPSSGMAARSWATAPIFVQKHQLAGADYGSLALKFVVADEADLDWALDLRDVADPERSLPFYLSALTPPDATLDQLAASYRNLCDLVLASPRARAHDPVCLPQLHVIAWGHERGV